jgi:hypothetical protein
MENDNGDCKTTDTIIAGRGPVNLKTKNVAGISGRTTVIDTTIHTTGHKKEPPSFGNLRASQQPDRNPHRPIPWL